MNQLSAMELITTTRGARSLLHEGYKYTLNRRTADGLQRLYKEDDDFRAFVNCVIALAFVSPTFEKWDTCTLVRQNGIRPNGIRGAPKCETVITRVYTAYLHVDHTVGHLIYTAKMVVVDTIWQLHTLIVMNSCSICIHIGKEWS